MVYTTYDVKKQKNRQLLSHAIGLSEKKMSQERKNKMLKLN